GAGGHATSTLCRGDRAGCTPSPTRRDHPATTHRGGARDVLAVRTLDLGWRQLDLDQRSVRAPADAGGGLGARPWGAATDRRIPLGHRPLGRITPSPR